MAGKRYCPSALVTAVWTPIIAGLVAVTVTPGSTALLVSVTRPLMVPVELAPPPWARADAGTSRLVVSTTRATWNARRLISPLQIHVGLRPHLGSVAPGGPLAPPP